MRLTRYLIDSSIGQSLYIGQRTSNHPMPHLLPSTCPSPRPSPSTCPCPCGKVRRQPDLQTRANWTRPNEFIIHRQVCDRRLIVPEWLHLLSRLKSMRYCHPKNTNCSPYYNNNMCHIARLKQLVGNSVVDWLSICNLCDNTCSLTPYNLNVFFYLFNLGRYDYPSMLYYNVASL